jgi:hypothetical protein
MKLFLDSGAFSVWNKNKTIDLEAYIAFCKKYASNLDCIASLDCIPGQPYKKVTIPQANEAAQQGFINYTKMLRSGLPEDKVLHTFHMGDPEQWLEKLIRIGAPYIGISPANDKTTEQKVKWLNQSCVPLITDGKGNAKVKFHGFAVTAPKLIFDYPWESVDSSSWRLCGGGFGIIFIPIKPHDLTIKENCDIVQTPIGTGIKYYQDEGKEQGGFFNLPRISQSDISFKSKVFRLNVESMLNKYMFSLKELEADASKRAAWNAIYLMDIVQRFSKVTLYLATNDLKSLDVLIKKMIENKMSMDLLNVLVSYEAVRRVKETSNPSVLDKLILMKNKFNT